MKPRFLSILVMAGLDPAIQGNMQKSLFGALVARRLDGRIKCGHDGREG